MSRKRDLRQAAIDLRRGQILDSLAQGLKIREICSSIKASEGTVKRDIGYLQKQSKENIRYFVEDRLIFEFDKSLATLDIINRRVWELTANADSKRESLEAYRLLGEINRERLDILTHSNMLKSALSISEKNNRKLDRLEAKYKAVSKNNTISEHSHDEIKREGNQPEIEQTTNADIEETAETTHKPEESNAKSQEYH